MILHSARGPVAITNLYVQERPATVLGYRIHSDGSLTSVVDSSQIVLPLSAIGLAAE